jgi:beta-fructofuranosidase
MELIAEIETYDAPCLELNVLRSPDRSEFTRIAFYRQRGYRNWARYTGWGREWQESRDSLITIDTSYSSALPDVQSRAPETAPIFLEPDEPLKLRVFIDRSVIEVFVNGKQCVAVRVYPGRQDSVGVSLRSQGRNATLRYLDAWQMAGIYD